MDDKQLKQYALNIYKGKRGYTFEKVASLFPIYYSRIMMHYFSILLKEQEKEITDELSKYNLSIPTIRYLNYLRKHLLLKSLKEVINLYNIKEKFKKRYTYKSLETGKIVTKEIIDGDEKEGFVAYKKLEEFFKGRPAIRYYIDSIRELSLEFDNQLKKDIILGKI